MLPSSWPVSPRTVQCTRVQRADLRGPSSSDAEELPIRLAHRVKELDELPQNLAKQPSIEKVKKWYAESFEVRPFSYCRRPTSSPRAPPAAERSNPRAPC